MRRTRTLLTALALTVGCGGDDTMVSDAVDRAIAIGNERGDMFANAAAQELVAADTKPDEMAAAAAIMRAIDEGEIAQATLALELVDDPVVAGYATNMLTAHREHAAQVAALGPMYGFAPKPTAVTAALGHEADEMIRALSASDDPTHLYVRQQVSMHEEARLILDELIRHFEDNAFQDFIQSTRDTIVDEKQDAVEILRGF